MIRKIGILIVIILGIIILYKQCGESKVIREYVAPPTIIYDSIDEIKSEIDTISEYIPQTIKFEEYIPQSERLMV